MYKLDNISSDCKQNIEWVSSDGTSVFIYLEYLPNQLGWFLNFKYKDIEINKIRVTTTYNMLRAYKSYIPFGILCQTQDDDEPLGINDFASGYAELCILSKQECNMIEDNYYVKV